MLLNEMLSYVSELPVVPRKYVEKCPNRSFKIKIAQPAQDIMNCTSASSAQILWNLWIYGNHGIEPANIFQILPGNEGVCEKFWESVDLES